MQECAPTHQPIAQSERCRILPVLALLLPLLVLLVLLVVLLVPLLLLPFVISRAGRTAGGVSTRHGAEPLVVPRLPDARSSVVTLILGQEMSKCRRSADR